MNTDGGFGEYIRVPKDWIISPNPFDKAPVTDKDIAGPSFTSMVYGTAGLTAGLCIEKLLTVGNAKPEDGPIAITGASGGVGSIAVEILAQKLGFEVIAISGSITDSSSESKHRALLELGAAGVVVSVAKRPVISLGEVYLLTLVSNFQIPHRTATPSLHPINHS